MKKVALLCISVILIGSVPAFAVDTNNTGVEKELQNLNHIKKL